MLIDLVGNLDGALLERANALHRRIVAGEFDDLPPPRRLEVFESEVLHALSAPGHPGAKAFFKHIHNILGSDWRLVAILERAVTLSPLLHLPPVSFTVPDGSIKDRILSGHFKDLIRPVPTTKKELAEEFKSATLAAAAIPPSPAGDLIYELACLHTRLRGRLWFLLATVDEAVRLSRCLYNIQNPQNDNS